MVSINSKLGAQGIGTLIIFIAMILVAAVAAGVLIQTASSLQSKSLDVGRQSQEKVTTDIEVIQVLATGASDGLINTTLAPVKNVTDNITLVVRLGSGSNSIKLNDLLVRFDTASGSQSLTYSGSSTYNASEYGVLYKIDGSNHQSGYLSAGDLAEVTFIYKSISDIVEGETATLRLISKNGAVKPVQMTTPSSMIESIVYLFP